MAVPVAPRLELTTFGDVDQFSEWEASQGWSMVSTQLSAGHNRIGYDHVELPAMTIARFRSRQSMVNRFELPAGTVVFLVMRSMRSLRWNRREVPPSLLAVVRDQDEHRVVIPAGLDCYEFVVSEGLIRDTELFPHSFFDSSVDPDRAFLPLFEPQTARFLIDMDGLFEATARAGDGVGPMLDQSVVAEIVIARLLDLIEVGTAEAGRVSGRMTRGAELVSTAQGLVKARLSDDLTTMEMARSLGVSYRALHYAFRDTLGVSPYRYLQTERLHAARRLLRTADVSVTDASTRVGIYSPGRFTHQYKRLFGELPSQTRARKVKRASPSRPR